MATEVVILPSGTKTFIKPEPIVTKSLTPKERLNKAFLEELARDFAKKGKEAIKEVREKNPSKYIELIASLLPKESNVNVNRNQSNQLDISISATADFIRDAITSRKNGPLTQFVQDGPVLPPAVRIEAPGCGAPLDIRQVPGSASEPERPSGFMGERAFQGGSDIGASADAERVEEAR